jgi:homocitrate synthase NifV
MKDPRTYEDLSPQIFGRTRTVVLGKHSGTSSVTGALHCLGLSASTVQTRILLNQIQARSIQAKRVVSTEELLEFYAEMDRSPHCSGATPEVRP